MKSLIKVLTLALFVNLVISAQAKISTHLNQIMLNPAHQKQEIPVIIRLNEKFDILELDKQLTKSRVSVGERAKIVIQKLQEHARKSQANLIEKLEAEDVKNIKSFWIDNVVAAEAAPSQIQKISGETEISYIDVEEELRIIKPVQQNPAPSSNPNHAEIGLKAINAHKMWKLGFTGEGVIVMNLDTGVEGDHSSLSENWLGYMTGIDVSSAWYDPVTSSNFPFDDNDHGSHTMGTMCGINRNTSDTIGVAFNAKWIAAKINLNSTLSVSETASLEAFQWALNPDGDPNTIKDLPAVVNCSWGGHTLCANSFVFPITALETAGIAVVFAIGNDGPLPGSNSAPGMNNTTEMNVFSVGAIDANNPGNKIAFFSSRGPTACIGEGNNIKPEVTAPGVYVRSSTINNSYKYFWGTSMATPHVSGAIALLKQAFPDKTGSELKRMLYETAHDLGLEGEDNDYGMGLIDVYAAYKANAVELNPKKPKNLIAYSDYTTPNSVYLTWNDPTNFVNGDALTNFKINISRDGEFIQSVEKGIEKFIDVGLFDGTIYNYEIKTHELLTDSLSLSLFDTVYAGGSPFPEQPKNLTCNYFGSAVSLNWEDPEVQTDGTPLDDLDKIYIYRDNILIDSVLSNVQTYTDENISEFSKVVFYFLEAKDNENPTNYSKKSDKISCLIGAVPEYLVWTTLTTKTPYFSSADSLFESIAVNGKSVVLTTNLFEYGNDLNIYKGIFIGLGFFPISDFLLKNSPEAVAIENYIENGGKLYLEADMAIFLQAVNECHNIRPWFSVEKPSPIYSNLLLSNLAGTDFLNNFAYPYNGILLPTFNMSPVNSTTFWQDNTGNSIGVWKANNTGGLSIGCIFPFGGLSSDTTNNNHFASNDIECFLENRKKFSDKDELLGQGKKSQININKRYSHMPSILSSSHKQSKMKNAGLNVSDSKIQLMFKYLEFFESNPPFSKNSELNSTYLIPGTDTLKVKTTVKNPKDYTIDVKSIIKSSNESLVDTIQLKKHPQLDSLYWGNWIIPNIEQNYKVEINTFANDLNTNHYIRENLNFTTAGPVVIDSISNLRQGISDPTRYSFDIFLKNNSKSVTVKGIGASIIPDTLSGCFTKVGTYHKYFSDLKPGEIKKGRNFTIYIDSICINNPRLLLPFSVDITCGGNPLWSDSLTLNIITNIAKDENQQIPTEFTLSQNYPNPFNPSTTIKYQIPDQVRNDKSIVTLSGVEESFIILKVYDILGREVATLVSQKQKPGNYEVDWNAVNHPSGVYFYKLSAGDYVETRKMILLR